MFRYSTLRSMLSLSPAAKDQRRRASQQHPSVRPILEVLEDRIVPADNVTCTAVPPTGVIFSPADQTVTVKANVSDTTNTKKIVDLGLVKFTILGPDGAPIGQSVKNVEVNGGVAQTSYTIPASTLAQSGYILIATYQDGQSGIKFEDTNDETKPFNIKPATVGITPLVLPPQTFNSKGQNLILTATVADLDHKDPPKFNVIEGVVSFSININGITDFITSGRVSKDNNTVNTTSPYPLQLKPGTYVMEDDYYEVKGEGTNYSSASVNWTLAIEAANEANKAEKVGAAFSPNAQMVTLSATVTNTSNPSDIPNEGTVTFNVPGIGTVEGDVVNGTAYALLTIPGGQNAGSYAIDVSYSDSSGDFVDSGDTDSTLTITCPPCGAVASASATQMAQNLGTYFGTITTGFFQSAQTVLNTFSSVLAGQESVVDLYLALEQFYQWYLGIQGVELLPPVANSPTFQRF